MVVDVLKGETMTEDKTTQQISSDEAEALATDYLKNMGNGKKNLLCGDFPEAVACFQLACSQQSERFGDTSHECAESFHYYGKALLELARMENGVLGNALKGVPETEDESESDTEEPQFEKAALPAEERKEIRKEVEDAMKENESESEENQDKSKKESTSDETPSTSDDKADENKEVFMETETKESKNGTAEKSDEAAPSASNGDSAEKTEETEEEEADPDDIPNMQLAWEMLELSKFLYKKKPSDVSNKLMLANCHLKLGELGLEVENYAQAIGDFLECLVIRKEHLEQSDRSLAETHYQLGLAYAFDQRYENALEHYNNALEVLDSRIDHLNKIIDDKDRDQKDDAESQEPHPECTEIGEIKALIPDINSKIEDVIVEKNRRSKLAGSPFRTTDAGAGSSSTTIGFAAPTTPTDKICTVIPVKRKEDAEKTEGDEKPAANGTATDISHLVRRKRASDNNEEEIGAAETKKIKTVENGKDAATNGTEKNGVETKKVVTNGNGAAPMEAA